ncbi:NAD-dependent epimerase/dehydratase family protein [Amedibacillus sp. YH-ame10]
MKKILITGGTVFVSRYIAEYYVKKGFDVYVLNRNTKEQSKGVNLIKADRYDIGDLLRGIHFDMIIDTAYTGKEVELLLDAIESYDDYILISSSAVYPESSKQPIKEDSKLGVNKVWGKYGTDKIDAEKILMKRNPNAYSIRPPYLYGQMNNVYRESFVFDCAMQNRKFYLPKDGKMKLQFFHIYDLCKFIDIILIKRPEIHIFNVGNNEVISVREWVELCYQIVGKSVAFVEVYNEIDQRNYFSFYDYEYHLDVSRQTALMGTAKPLYEGLEEAFDWYKNHMNEVNKKSFLEYIDKNII